MYVQNRHVHGDRVGSWLPRAGEGNGGATADGDGVSFGGGGRFCDGTEVTAARHWECTKCHRAADFKTVNLMLCEFHLHKKKKRKGRREGGREGQAQAPGDSGEGHQPQASICRRHMVTGGVKVPQAFLPYLQSLGKRYRAGSVGVQSLALHSPCGPDPSPLRVRQPHGPQGRG